MVHYLWRNYSATEQNRQ